MNITKSNTILPGQNFKTMLQKSLIRLTTKKNPAYMFQPWSFLTIFSPLVLQFWQNCVEFWNMYVSLIKCCI